MNMNYCRFHNTEMDLRECVYALQDNEEISNDELYKAEQIRQLCEEYIEAFDNYSK